MNITNDKTKLAVSLKNEGLTYKKIGERLNVSASRVSQYICREKRQKDFEDLQRSIKPNILLDDTVITEKIISACGFSVRSYNCLRNDFVGRSIGELKKEIKYKLNLLQTPNFGRKCLKEMALYFGIDDNLDVKTIYFPVDEYRKDLNECDYQAMMVMNWLEVNDAPEEIMFAVIEIFGRAALKGILSKRKDTGVK